MTFVLYTTSVSAHQLPLAREIVRRLGAENFRYVYTGAKLQGGAQEVASEEPWVVKESDLADSSSLLETCDVLLVGGMRPTELIARRLASGRTVLYMTERWFKPIEIKVGQWCFHLPGKLRMLVPGYRRMAKRWVKWLKEDSRMHCLAIGPWAKKDMLWLGVPETKIMDWGYFVERSKVRSEARGQWSDSGGASLRLLWVGRMLDWKRVDTIVKAVARVNQVEGGRSKVEQRWKCSLTLVGDGPEKERLQKLADKLQTSNFKLQTVSFLPSIPIAEVRGLMREHDVYILSSNAQEGWGAVVNEAAEEGMIVLGTDESGAPAAMLPAANRFRCGDVAGLADLLRRILRGDVDAPRRIDMSPWRPSAAAERLLNRFGLGIQSVTPDPT